MDDLQLATTRVRTLIERINETPRRSAERLQRAIVLFEYCATRGRMLLHYPKIRHAIAVKLDEFAEMPAPPAHKVLAQQYRARIAHLIKTHEFPRTRL